MTGLDGSTGSSSSSYLLPFTPGLESRGRQRYNPPGLSRMSLKHVLFVGDIVGDVGLGALQQHLPPLIERLSADFVIVNGENTCDGKGLRPSDAAAIFGAGAHVITSGNHVWERWQSKDVLARERNVLRPLNYPRENVGRGFTVVTLDDGVSIGVLNIQGRTYMQPIDCPFKGADWAIEKMREETSTIIVDFHAEATAEKGAMACYLDGRVAAVLGTHTHVQTADARILPGGTAFITDVGMTGPYDSVIGMKKDVAIRRFILQTPHKFELASDDPRLSAVLLTVDTANGHAISIAPITVPSFDRGAAVTSYDTMPDITNSRSETP